MFEGPVVDPHEEQQSPGFGVLWVKLHGESAKRLEKLNLPLRGATWHRRQLGAALEKLEAALNRDEIDGAEKEILSRTRSMLTHDSSDWQSLTDLIEELPRCLVHGDFLFKNIRFRSRVADGALVVFDWEMAGNGIPGFISMTFAGCSSLELRTTRLKELTMR